MNVQRVDNKQYFGQVKPNMAPGLEQTFPRIYSSIVHVMEKPEIKKATEGKVLSFSIAPTIVGYQNVDGLSVMPIVSNRPARGLIVSARKEAKTKLQTLFAKEPRIPLYSSSETEVERAIVGVLNALG